VFVEAGVHVEVEESLRVVSVGASRSDAELRRIVRLPVELVAPADVCLFPIGFAPSTWGDRIDNEYELSYKKCSPRFDSVYFSAVLVGSGKKIKK